ncbi:mechanosensitive ion channel family protein [Rhodoferax sp. PAMC 29310]|uniref:mechanosensitive ion channel family protein n=1 Tax=Rhodoferax sp. PAMC 29310 TaxID=2822760 RepID=UPI001B32EB4F|nr:mechanosensitive ion channel domain-containing protein [Rhodoferax sp. PAMC 29310]
MSEGGIPSLEGWIAALTRPAALAELAALVASGVLAWAFCLGISRASGPPDKTSILFGRRIVDGALFPLLWLPLAYLAQALLARWVPMAVFKIAIPVLMALVVIRVGVKVLQVAFGNTRLIRVLERTISWVAWLAMVLWVSGLLPLILDELDRVTWTIGGSSMSIRTLIEGILTAGAVLIIALWISSAIEARLLRAATGGALSLRKAVSNATRAFLMFVGLLVALSAVGIDLTALSVLGGAIGVGVGFGLQKLASNYVSGFVILAERSMRIGDNVRVDNFEGVITQINARYTVIRSLGGRESIVPNELLIITRVENLSLSDSRVWLSTLVSVSYDSDVELVMGLLQKAASSQNRVLNDPAPSVTLINFGADGLELKVGYWISDPENGSDGLKSLINLEILRSLREHHIEIPFPQRVVHTAPLEKLPVMPL